MSYRVKRVTRASMVVALLLAVGGYLALRHSVPTAGPASCDASGTGQPLPLDVDQAGIAATIAAVARHHAMPPYAVTVAFAAALQESKLTNLHSGDLDSVGVFQQRPSEGWGPAVQLEDPVYASVKFFDALSRVRGYPDMPVYQAAQAVQHSADGSAYAQYTTVAARLSAAFTGQRPHAVWCWYPSLKAQPRPGAASLALTRAFGPLAVTTAADPGRSIAVTHASDGWAVAAWLVSHAGTYGIRHIAYDGYQWRSSRAASGWTKLAAGATAAAPASAVMFG